MIRTLTNFAGVAIAAAFLASPAAAATAAKAPATGKASPAMPAVAAKFNGYWRGWNDGPPQPESEVNTPRDKNRYPPTLLAVLKPWAMAGLKKYQAAAETDMEPPTPDNQCLPFAMPGERASSGFPTEWQITPKVAVLLIQIDHQMRIIHMNQQHPKDLQPSWYGHSVGRWEGDTLVVDTVGYNDRSEFSDGVPHSPKLHSVERYRLFDNGKKLEATITYDDPDAFTAPWTVVRKFQRTDAFQEYVNAENNQLYPCPNADTGSRYRPLR